MFSPNPLQQAVDSLRATGQSTAFDSIWANTIPTKAPSALEEVMLSHDKLYVVLAVVLIIWIGITIFLVRTDRRIDELERLVEDRITDEDPL
jgi:CcmD family protein